MVLCIAVAADKTDLLCQLCVSGAVLWVSVSFVVREVWCCCVAVSTVVLRVVVTDLSVCID